MGKHIDSKTKYHYLIRYLNGETPRKLDLEINPQLKNLTVSIIKTEFYNIKKKGSKD